MLAVGQRPATLSALACRWAYDVLAFLAGEQSKQQGCMSGRLHEVPMLWACCRSCLMPPLSCRPSMAGLLPQAETQVAASGIVYNIQTIGEGRVACRRDAGWCLM